MGNNHIRTWSCGRVRASIGGVRKSVAVTVVVLGVLLVLAVVAGAATITTPKGPVKVAADAKGNPAPFVVAASGFSPGANIFAEQCDGNAPSTPRWSATLNCDLGSAPPPAIADANGVATFNGQSMFQPVAGPSPQHLFNCIAPGTAPPKNHLKTYTNCQVRVSSNNSQNTQDQSFVTMVLPGPNAPRQPATTTSTAPAAGANHSSTTSVPKGAHAGKAKGAKAGRGRRCNTERGKRDRPGDATRGCRRGVSRLE